MKSLEWENYATVDFGVGFCDVKSKSLLRIGFIAMQLLNCVMRWIKTVFVGQWNVNENMRGLIKMSGLITSSAAATIRLEIS